jgi:hypothetical protein
MMTLAASGVYLALMKHQTANFLGGMFTGYLVATAWKTARRKNEETGMFDWVALVVVLAVGATDITYGLEAGNSPTGLKDGDSAGMYFFLASLAALAAAGDVRMLVRGGVTGVQRLARHLWRMCYAQFIAAVSIFLARKALFPALLQKTGALYFLSFLPLLVMIFWLFRVRIANAYKRKEVLAHSPEPALSAH